jgi:hypothetical protein
MFSHKRDNTPAPSAGQRIAQLNYETTVRDMATFTLNGTRPTPRQVQDAVESGRAAGISPQRLAQDADAMRAWANRS